MDQEFERRWQEARAPFAQGVVESDFMRLPSLRRVLVALADLLEVGAEAGLSRLDDWHEHDGYITTAKPTSWRDVRAALSEDDRLLAFASDDTFVRVGLFPGDRSWYLRFCITRDPDDFGADGHDPGGVLDLSGPPQLLASAERALAGLTDLKSATASDFFRKGWGAGH